MCSKFLEIAHKRVHSSSFPFPPPPPSSSSSSSSSSSRHRRRHRHFVTVIVIIKDYVLTNAIPKTTCVPVTLSQAVLHGW